MQNLNLIKFIIKNKYLIAVLLILGAQIPLAYAQPQPAEVLGIYFTPPTGAAHGLVKHLDEAKKSIRVMAYGFTSSEISQALLRAKQRGLRVELIQDDKSAHSNSDAIAPLVEMGILVRNDAEHAIAHNKVILIDDDVVVTGSYNFTNSAEKRNAENFIILKSAYAAKRYADNWAIHWAHARPLTEVPRTKRR